MGLSRRRDNSNIWPGFVDAVTTLLMVLMFVLTIFTVMQSVLRETITTQGTELQSLTAQVAELATVASQASELRDELKAWDGAKATRLIDPQLITRSRWANRVTVNICSACCKRRCFDEGNALRHC